MNTTLLFRIFFFVSLFAFCGVNTSAEARKKKPAQVSNPVNCPTLHVYQKGKVRLDNAAELTRIKSAIEAMEACGDFHRAEQLQYWRDRRVGSIMYLSSGWVLPIFWIPAAIMGVQAGNAREVIEQDLRMAELKK